MNLRRRGNRVLEDEPEITLSYGRTKQLVGALAFRDSHAQRLTLDALGHPGRSALAEPAANETSRPTDKRTHRLAQKTALLSQEWRRRESNPGSVTTPSSCVGSARCDAGSTAFGRLQTVDRDPVMYAGSGHRSFDMTEMVIQATASIRRILERGWLLSGESWGFTAFGQPTQPRAWGLGRRAAASTRARPHTRRLSV